MKNQTELRITELLPNGLTLCRLTNGNQRAIRDAKLAREWEAGRWTWNDIARAA